MNTDWRRPRSPSRNWSRVLSAAGTYAYSEYRRAQRLAASFSDELHDPVHTLARMERAEWHCAELDRAELDRAELDRAALAALR